jgi:hypothetical protein
MNSGATEDRNRPEAAKPQDEQEAAGDSAPFSKYIYFYYVTPAPAGDHHPNVKAYFISDDWQPSEPTIKDQIRRLAEQARRGALGRAAGMALGDLNWRYKSYLVVVLDAPGADSALQLDLEITDGGHTFEGKTLTDVTADGAKLRAVYFRNRIKKANNGTWNRQPECFKLDLKVSPAAGLGPPIFTHDDVGTNLGPPRGGG